MKRFVTVFLLLLAALPGCQGTQTTQPIYYPFPENAIESLAHLYTNMDPVKYDSTLAPGYVFRFQPYDVTAGQSDSLVRAEEMSFARNLFVNGAGEGAPRATRTRLVVVITSSGPDLRAGHSGWVKYVVNTNLTLSFASNPWTTSVSGPAWWYFRQVPEGSGCWKLAEWADQPLIPGSGRSRTLPQGALAATPVTWGMLHKLYQ
jgi:hypothetical protein